MSDDHSHGPHWIFKLGILLNLSFLISDLIVWQMSGSVAIFGDALHNGLHGMVHITALWGHSLEKNSHGRKESYASKLRKNQSTQLIGCLIIAGALLICAFGVLQVYDPGEVAGKYMIIMAPLDIVGDIFIAVLLIRHKGDTTAKAVFVDTSIDILASMGVIAGGIVILFTGYYRADGIAAIPIALIALYLARQTIRDAKKVR